MKFLTQLHTKISSALKRFALSILCMAVGTSSYAQKNIYNLQTAYKNATDNTKRLVALNDLAEWYNYRSPDSAQVYAKLAYQMHEKATDDFQKVRAIAGLGVALSKTKTPLRQVRAYFDEALKEAEKSKKTDALGFVWVCLGDFYLQAGKVEEAILQYEEAKKIYESAPIKDQLQKVYHQLGIAHNRAGKAEVALANYFKARMIIKSLARKDTAGILSDIGNVYYNQGNFAEALQYYHLSLSTSKQQKDAFAQGFALNNIGLVHNGLGNHDEALDYHLQALKKREEAKSEEGIANSYTNIGNSYIQLGYHEKGQKFLAQGLVIDTKLGKRLSVATSLDRMGLAFLQNKKNQEALEKFEDALKIRKEMGQIVGVGVSYNHLGMAYMHHKDFPNAIAYLKRADSIFTQAQAQDKLTQTYLLLAKVYFEVGDAQKSEKYAENAFKFALKRRTKSEIIESAQLLAQLYAKQGAHAKAFEMQNQAIAYKDSLYIEEKNKRNVRMQALFEFKQQEKELKELKNDNFAIIRLQYISSGIFTLFIVVLGVFVYYLAISRKRNQATNKAITKQAREIETQKEAIETQNLALQTAHKSLKETNQELLDSINYAHRIQKAVLPTHAEIATALPHHFILYKPRNVVSGDFYWISDKQHHTVVAIMDCTGHGIPGAFMSLIGNHILHEVVNLREIIEPATILTELKKRVNIVLKQQSTQGRDGMDIGVCTIDHAPIRQGIERKLYFASAHLSLLYFQENQMYEAEGSKIYIGGYDPDDTERHFETEVINLDKTTACYLFSDGYQDQFAENSKKKFSKKRLKALITEVHTLSVESQHEILNKNIDDWKGQTEQTDDIMVFGVVL